MRNAARFLGRPKLMPTDEELRDIDRAELARAIKYNGGARKIAELCGLRLQKPIRRNEAPLRHLAREKTLVPYPARRFDPKLSQKVGDEVIRFEVSPSTPTGTGRVEEYGLWVFGTDDSSRTYGRFGWVRRKAGDERLWLYRLEGESRWCGALKQHDLDDAIAAALYSPGLVTPR